MEEIVNIRKKLEQKKGQRDLILSQLNQLQKDLNKAKKQLIIAEEGQLIIQHIAKKTQDEIEYRISELVSLALETVSDNPYKFKLKFPEKRGKTECRIIFTRNGREFDPMFYSGHGFVNVAALALRFSLWKIENPRTRNTIILDEPAPYLKDPMMHRKLNKLIKTISDEILPDKKLQIIIIPPMEEKHSIPFADKTFKIKNVKGISIVEEVLDENQDFIR